MKKIIAFLFLFFSIYSISQTNLERTLFCIVISDHKNEIYILNLHSQKSVVTEKNTQFKLLAFVGDTIQINSVNYKTKKIIIGINDFFANPFNIKLELLTNQLDEVTVFKNRKFHTSNMKFTDTKIKKFTPAERKLNTASNPYIAFKSGLTFSVDPIINILTGRTAMLDKIVAIERKEITITKTENLFDDDFFIQKLKIPIEYVKGFQFFIVDDVEYSTAIKLKNKTLAQFRMGELALKYLDLISEKNSNFDK